MPEHWMPRTVLTIAPRLGSLKLEKNDTRNDPYRLVFIVKVLKKRIAAPVFGIIGVDY